MVLALREVLEASEAQNEGHPSPPSVRGAVTTALRLLNDDPGVGFNLQRSALVHALTADGRPRAEVHFEGLEYYQVADAVHDPQKWSRAIASNTPPPPERTSRAIAAHLLDLGSTATSSIDGGRNDSKTHEREKCLCRKWS
jgi:hypothetical protein